MYLGKESFRYASAGGQQAGARACRGRRTNYGGIDHRRNLDKAPADDKCRDSEMILEAAAEEEHTARVERDRDVARPAAPDTIS